MHDIAEFLGRHAPFDRLGEPELQELARGVEVEYFPAGAAIAGRADAPGYVRVVRRGAVDVLEEDRVVDHLEEGELFGHQGTADGLDVSAHDDTLIYRMPPEAVDAALASRPDRSRPPGAASAGSGGPGEPGRPAAGLASSGVTAGSLVAGGPTIATPDTPLGDVASKLGAGRDGAVLIDRGGGLWGIVTDADLREAITRGMDAGSPVEPLMTPDPFSVEPESRGAEVVLEMFARGIRHVPVIPARGEPIGVISDMDLLAAETATPFAVRRAIARAAGLEDLRDAAGRLWPGVALLHRARVETSQISSIAAVVVDALIARVLEMVVERAGTPPCPFSWLTLGSFGRREPAPSSDLDSALLWEAAEGDEGPREYMAALGERAGAELAACGLAADEHGVSASDGRFVRSREGWRQQLRESTDDPYGEEGLIMISLFMDGRPGFRYGPVGDLYDELGEAGTRAGYTNLMLRDALRHRPPTGFVRDFVLVHSGERSPTLNVKRGGILPVSSIARYASMAAGRLGAATTRERLELAASAGTLDAGTAQTLGEAHELFSGLRLDHQIEQVERGEEPDDLLDTKRLTPLTRRYLRDAFGEVRAVQKRLASKLVPRSLHG